MSTSPIAEQADLLELIATDRIHADDRQRVEQAIRDVAAMNDGLVDPSLVNARLTNRAGDLDVYPRVIGATYSAMRASGEIEPDGWTTNQDRRGRNAGRPARLWRVVA